MQKGEKALHPCTTPYVAPESMVITNSGSSENRSCQLVLTNAEWKIFFPPLKLGLKEFFRSVVLLVNFLTMFFRGRFCRILWCHFGFSSTNLQATITKGRRKKMLSLMFENEKMVYQCRCYYSVQDFILGALLTLITPFERVILESKTLRNLEWLC